MNKNFFIVALFFISFLRPADQTVSLPERLPLTDVVRVLPLWSVATIIFEGVNYYCKSIPSKKYDPQPTSNRKEYATRKLNDLQIGSKNAVLKCVQLSSQVLADQVTTNCIGTMYGLRPAPIEFNQNSLLRAYVANRLFKSDTFIGNFYECMANRFLGMRIPTVYKQFFFEAFRAYALLIDENPTKNDLGLQAAKALPFALLPLSGKLFGLRFATQLVAKYFLKKSFPNLSKLELSLVLSLEFGEHIVKSWTGQYHVNDRLPFSLHWLLVIPFVYHLIKNENLLSMVNISNEKKVERLSPLNRISVAKDEDSIKPSFGRYQKEVSLLHKYKSYEDFVQLSDRHKKLLRESFEKAYPQSRFFHKHAHKAKQKEYQRSLLRYSFIALAIGLFFHAFLDSAFYWYGTYSKV